MRRTAVTGRAAAEPGSPGRRTGPGTTPGQTGWITTTRTGSAAGHRPVRNTPEPRAWTAGTTDYERSPDVEEPDSTAVPDRIVRVAQVQGQSHNVTYPCQSVDPYRLRAATSAKDRRAEAAPNGGSTCGYAKTCSPRLVGRQRYARATTASSPGPGHCDCRDRARDGPLPIRPLPADTQFAQAMPELGRQHRYMGAAPNPRILTGWFGASSHGLRFPVRAFLRFPVCPPGLFPVVRRPPASQRSAFSGSVPSAVAFRFGSRRIPSGFPSP